MLTERLRATQQADAALAGNDQLMEALMPGWIEHGRKLSQDVERSVNESIAEAQEDADTVLNAPVLPHVESGWKRMGGAVIGELRAANRPAAVGGAAEPCWFGFESAPPSRMHHGISAGQAVVSSLAASA